MTELKEMTKQKNSTVALLCTILPACIAAASFRWGAGIWMILPIYPLCVAVSSVLSRYFPIKLWLRAAFFPVMTSLLNMMLGDSTTDTLIAAIIAASSFLLIELAVALCMSKRAFRVVCGVTVAVLCVMGTALYLGNPFSALQADGVLRSYIEAHYDTEAGGHTFGDIRLDHRTGYYAVTASNVEFPTEVCHILVADGFVIDHYRDVLEDQETRDEALEITKTLRESFGTDMFSIVQTGIGSFSRSLEHYSVYNTTDYASHTDFCIRMSGKPTMEKLFDAALNYHTVLEASDLVYDEILYLGGEGLRFRMAVRIPSKDDIFDREIETSVYILRHNENHGYLQQNGIIEFIDRKFNGSLMLYH